MSKPHPLSSLSSKTVSDLHSTFNLKETHCTLNCLHAWGLIGCFLPDNSIMLLTVCFCLILRIIFFFGSAFGKISRHVKEIKLILQLYFNYCLPYSNLAISLLCGSISTFFILYSKSKIKVGTRYYMLLA